MSANYLGCNSAPALKGVASDMETETSVQSVGVTMHPNPVTSAAEMKLIGFENGDIRIEVLNANGQSVKTLEHKYSAGNNVMLDFGSLHSGLYLIRVKQGDRMAITKIVKH